MLFGYIEDEKYIDLIDEQGKLFKRFLSSSQYEVWVSRFSPADLKGLSKKETLVKWYDSNRQLFKLFFPVVFVGFCIIKALQ